MPLPGFEQDDCVAGGNVGDLADEQIDTRLMMRVHDRLVLVISNRWIDIAALAPQPEP